ncbi:A1pp-domain-containing protein [Mycena belliarum]|uniref:A1pp-domain-containing protein n=1 Tax=Mycena belliarum TaxID=1033014 RepID=A0AAD6XUW2_9AGAR|nr:A1pp-domain-containing protein [Mycena belliae]
MSHSSSDSDSDSDDDIIVRLADIRTIGQLFQSGVLKGVAKPRYAPNPAFLDRISLFQGDITVMEVDSIVNAANRSLLGGGGVDGAIHAAAGRQLLEECSGLGGCDTGESKITAAYKLPSKHIIHTVGPIYSRSDIERRAQQLESCYRTSLNLAVEKSLKHIAFPSISTGIYGYPIEDATHLALDLVRRFCELDVGSKLDRVIFVVWSNKDKEVYETLIPEYFPPSDAPEELVASDAPSAGPPVERPAEASVLDAPAAASVSEEHKASGEEPNVP